MIFLYFFLFSFTLNLHFTESLIMGISKIFGVVIFSLLHDFSVSYFHITFGIKSHSHCVPRCWTLTALCPLDLALFWLAPWLLCIYKYIYFFITFNFLWDSDFINVLKCIVFYNLKNDGPMKQKLRLVHSENLKKVFELFAIL